MGNLASAVDELLALDANLMSGPGLAETIVELRRQINRAEAAYLQLLERLDRTGAATADHGSTAAWVRAELHRSPAAASADVHLARDLADAFPATRAALADGSLSPAHARLICSLRTSISPEAISSAEPHLVEWAGRSTPKELRAVIAHVNTPTARTRPKPTSETTTKPGRCMPRPRSPGSASGTGRCTRSGRRP